jgi:uncharacterized protein
MDYRQPSPPRSTSSAACLDPTARTTLKRRAQRGSYERSAIDAILDEALICHAGVEIDGVPRVLPLAHVRVGDAVYLHGARANGLLGALARGKPCCLTVTLLDGLVFSREAFHHSVNYRSVVLYGAGAEVTDLAEKRAALHALVEHLAKGRAAEARPPSDEELSATLLVRVPIREGSAKARSGPPNDRAELLGDACWAGELPLKLCALLPRPDAHVPEAQAVSAAVIERARDIGLLREFAPQPAPAPDRASS